MDSSNEKFQERFKAMLASLSPEKRNQLFSVLQKMDKNERDKAMVTILQRYEASVTASADKSHDKQAASAASHVSNNKEQAAHRPGGKPHQEHSNSETAKQNHSHREQPGQRMQNEKIDDNDFDKKPQKAKKDQEAKKRNVAFPVLLTLILLLAAVAAVLFFMNRGSKDDDNDEETVSTAVTVATDPSETEAPATPTSTPSPTPSPSPTPTLVPLAEDAPDLSGLVIVIDPGHQAETSSQTESAATWLSVDKPRSTSGSQGVVTGINEYELTLDYALTVRDYLQQCGATVVLTRTENEVDISNQERAQIAVDNNADLFIRIYAGAANDSAQSGVKVYVPDSGSYTSSSVAWGNDLGNKIAEAEGLEFLETMQTYLYTGLNYANTQRAFQINLGFLSNSDDEAILVSEENRAAVAAAISEFCAEFK